MCIEEKYQFTLPKKYIGMLNARSKKEETGQTRNVEVELICRPRGWQGAPSIKYNSV